ncbi:MAG TPA: RsfS/YbeB/iojap family protein, partial [Desulfosporosinus sp.]|nr:RsfS/YbeB/iojap family protein [Desulfosporosinus sp.]
VHVMTPDEREFYQLERLWKDAGVISFDPTIV